MTGNAWKWPGILKNVPTVTYYCLLIIMLSYNVYKNDSEQRRSVRLFNNNILIKIKLQ